MSDITETDEAGTSEDGHALAITLDSIIRNVPGVVGLAAAQPTLLRAAKESVGVLTGSPVQIARVSVKDTRGALAIEANILVADELAAPVVAAEVHRAIVAALPGAAAAGQPTITVRVIDVVPSGAQD